MDGTDGKPVPRRHDGFPSVNRLDGTGLRELLTSGDPAERVWAAWALGLRLGDSVTELVSPAIVAEPDPGVRAQLVVILAGAHELEAVREMAAADDDADVRATACAYVHRLASDRDDVVAAFLADRFRSDSSWVVRRRLVALSADRQFLDDPDLDQAMRDSDVSVRREAFRVVNDVQFARLADSVWSRLTDPMGETDSEIRTEFLMRLLRIEGLPGALRRIEAASGASDEAWRAIRGARMRADWDHLAFLADGSESNEERLVDLLAVGIDSRALTWLVRSMLQPAAIWLDALHRLALLDAAGYAALSRVVGGLAEADRRVISSRVLEKIQAWRAETLEDEWDDGWERIEVDSDSLEMLDRLSEVFSA